MFIRRYLLYFALLSLTISARGDLKLYVSNFDGTTGTNGRVTQFNADTGRSEGDLIPPGGNLTLPDGLAAGPDGKLYVSDFYTGTVQKYDPVRGTFIKTFVKAG